MATPPGSGRPMTAGTLHRLGRHSHWTWSIIVIINFCLRVRIWIVDDTVTTFYRPRLIVLTARSPFAIDSIDMMHD